MYKYLEWKVGPGTLRVQDPPWVTVLDGHDILRSTEVF